MSEARLSPRERFMRWALTHPQIYPDNNYHVPNGPARRLWQRGLDLLGSSLSPPAARWPALYGGRLPRLAVLDSPKSGGSHFVLHHLQRHPELLCLHEHILSHEVRQYYLPQGYPLYRLVAGQLVPYKSDLGRVKRIVINKPVMESIYRRLYAHRADFTLLPLLRNPVDFCLAAANRRSERASDEALTQLEDYWLATLRQFVRKGVDFFDPAHDLPLNLEHFALHPPQALAAVEARLGLERCSLGRSLRLERCARCGGELRNEPRPVKARPAEDVLACARCRASYIGPGGFNLLREMGRAEFGRWAHNPRAPRLDEACEAFFGREWMDYFRREHYLRPDGHLEFEALFAQMAARLKTGAARLGGG